MGLYAGFDVVGDFGYLGMTETWGIVPDYSAGCDVFVSTFISDTNSLLSFSGGFCKKATSNLTVPSEYSFQDAMTNEQHILYQREQKQIENGGQDR